MEIKLLSLLNKEERKKVKALIFSKKSIIHNEGSICNEIGILISGEAKIESISPSGRTITYKILKVGEVYGNNLVFASENFYKGDVIVSPKSTIAIISKNDLKDLLRNNESFLLEYLRIQSDFSKQMNARIKVLTSDNTIDKVLNDLEISGGQKEIKSITSWANEINESRENLSRILSKMIKNNLIKKEEKVYKLVNTH